MPPTQRSVSDTEFDVPIRLVSVAATADTVSVRLVTFFRSPVNVSGTVVVKRLPKGPEVLVLLYQEMN